MIEHYGRHLMLTSRITEGNNREISSHHYGDQCLL